MKDYISQLAALTEAANGIRLAVVEEEDWAMVANHLRAIEVDLAKKRREIEQEATEVAQTARDAQPMGKKLVYESDRGNLVEQTRRAYSYNSSGILKAVMEMGGDMSVGAAVALLQSSNALELKWKISFLENVFDRLGFDYRKAHHEIEDGDPEYLVGVVSTSKMVRG